MFMGNNVLSCGETQRAVKYFELGSKHSAIAKCLGRDRTTIHRLKKRYEELLRTVPVSGGDESSSTLGRILYNKACERKSAASRNRVRLGSKRCQEFISKSLESKHGVIGAVGRWNRKNPNSRIQNSSVYDWINNENHELKKYLPNAGKYQRRRIGGGKKKKPLPVHVPKVSIHERPTIINERLRVGDFELDAVVSCRGARSALQVLVCRKTRSTWIAKVLCLEADTYAEVLIRQISKIGLINSITTDNGSEHALFNTVAKLFDKKWFFCDPHTPSQRGSVENLNRAIRKTFPKGTNFDDVSDLEVQQLQEALNNRPLKVLDFRTPNEAWCEDQLALAA